jgi:uncharacterized protein
MKIIKFFQRQTRLAALFAITFYQKTLSFDHGHLAKLFPFWGCRFYPTCSQYTYQAIEKYGIFKGIWLGFKRILRCTPLSKGGHDPLV